MSNNNERKAASRLKKSEKTWKDWLVVRPIRGWADDHFDFRDEQVRRWKISTSVPYFLITHLLLAGALVLLYGFIVSGKTVQFNVNLFTPTISEEMSFIQVNDASASNSAEVTYLGKE